MEDLRELQLLPTALSMASSSSWPTASPARFRSSSGDQTDAPPLDLQLSISVKPIRPAPNYTKMPPVSDYGSGSRADFAALEALRWQAAEQVRLAAAEKAYAERVRELSRREIELAQSEFARAKQLWDRARREVDKAERMKAMAMIDSMSMEVTCHSCRQKFRPRSNPP